MSCLSNGIGALSAACGSAIAAIPAVRTLIDGVGPATVSRAWAVPFGSFTVQLGPLSAWFALPNFALSALAAVYGFQYLQHDVDRKALGVSWFFYNLLVASMVLVVIARNSVLFLVAWEMMAIWSYFLVVYEHEKQSVRDAGRTYLIASHLGTAFLLAFFVLLGREAGSLD